MMPRDWSRIPPTSVLGWTLRLPLRLIPKGTVVPVLSGLNRGMKWTTGSGIHSLWLGGYEIDKQTTLAPFVKPGMMVYDVGAHAGFYTLIFSRLVGETGHVYTFEPLPENANNLLRHISLNRLRNVSVLPVAVSNRDGISGFEVAPSNSMGAISQNEARLRVPTVSLDNLISHHTLPEPNLIKMDVEGAESSVLEGAQTLLRKNKTVWFIALHGDEEKRQCYEIMKRAGYTVFLLNGSEVLHPDFQGDEIYAVPNNAPCDYSRRSGKKPKGSN